MEITLEQVERLREKAQVSYGQCKQALEYSGGNLLDALIYLEEQGVIPRPEQSYYSTKKDTPPPTQIPVPLTPPPSSKKRRFPLSLNGIFKLLRRIFLEHDIEIWRKQNPVLAVPVLVVVLFFVFAFPVAVFLSLLCLFVGFRYQISGPDLKDDTINHMMGNVADTAADMGQQVVEELKKQHEKYKYHYRRK